MSPHEVIKKTNQHNIGSIKNNWSYRPGLYIFAVKTCTKRHQRYCKQKKNIQPLYVFNLLHEGLVLLKKMVEEFELNMKLCFLDKTPFTQSDYEFLESPVIYNGKIKKAIEALNEQLPTFALVDNGITPKEKLCLLIERGAFWGMGYIPKKIPVTSSAELKNYLNPYADNDYIRNSIYAFAETYPEKKIKL